MKGWSHEQAQLHIVRGWNENRQVHGMRKVWRSSRVNRQLARCTVGRLMRRLGLQGVVRGEPVRTTLSDKTTPRPLDIASHLPFAQRIFNLKPVLFVW